MTNTSRPLTRKLSALGMGTFRSEVNTNPSLAVFLMALDGKLSYGDLTRLVEERILPNPAFERLTFRVDEHKSSFHRMDVDLKYHIVERHISELPTDNQLDYPDHVSTSDTYLLPWLSEFTTSELDESHPLWQIYLIQGCENDSSTLVFKFHHCIGDGTSLAFLLSKFVDPSKESAASVPTRTPVNPATSAEVSWAKAFSTEFKKLIILILTALYFLLGIVMYTCKITYNLCLAEASTSLKAPLRGKRRVGWTKPVKLDEVKKYAKYNGCTLNDIMLSVATGALRKYMFSEHKLSPEVLEQPLRVGVPVNLRIASDYDEKKMALSNTFGFIILRLPTLVEDPVDRVKTVHRDMKKAKNSHEKDVSNLASKALTLLPKCATDPIVKTTNQHLSFVCTNVPGPTKSIYINNIPVRTGIGVVPPPAYIGLGLAIWTYYGQLMVSISCDDGININPWKFAALMNEELDILGEMSKN